WCARIPRDGGWSSRSASTSSSKGRAPERSGKQVCESWLPSHGFGNGTAEAVHAFVLIDEDGAAGLQTRRAQERVLALLKAMKDRLEHAGSDTVHECDGHAGDDGPVQQ